MESAKHSGGGGRVEIRCLGWQIPEVVPFASFAAILVDDKDEFRITVRLRITNDFVMELLSRSRSLEVIRPQHLRERIRQVYEEALKRNK